jgi:hypothetical protein
MTQDQHDALIEEKRELARLPRLNADEQAMLRGMRDVEPLGEPDWEAETEVEPDPDLEVNWESPE